mmetsp:Transcript_3025/g.5619  ORF Transcript_3025/g.5619 Transcript_3025/m.5619 type:complete len:165 (-) Transcript_3025:488-982(-)|eukprot:CAMPEP_0197527096 /NCGR_PEP_ID=MMETSP1318-20131121/20308_1 /TAXON_ID=552666 /ORGANISM="Partenskyella glossopodia, Strain RCC365" /LENGTH=164 /DNA_ID=CAMNT_0043081565 /DNA_START=33 /DNA_END=527 /DNA_ORIENTATION=-
MASIFKGLRSAVSRVSKKFTGKELVGTDKLGNRYVVFKPYEDSKERRLVETPSGFYDKDEMHKLWSMWLSGTKDTPPTDAEMDEYDQRQVILAARVQKVQEEDDKKRLEERMDRELSQEPESPSVSLSGVLSAMNKDESSSATKSEDSSSGGGKFQPKSWTPDS